jgi:hypothetical protein
MGAWVKDFGELPPMSGDDFEEALREKRRLREWEMEHGEKHPDTLPGTLPVREFWC